MGAVNASILNSASKFTKPRGGTRRTSNKTNTNRRSWNLPPSICSETSRDAHCYVNVTDCLHTTICPTFSRIIRNTAWSNQPTVLDYNSSNRCVCAISVCSRGCLATNNRNTQSAANRVDPKHVECLKFATNATNCRAHSTNSTSGFQPNIFYIDNDNNNDNDNDNTSFDNQPCERCANHNSAPFDYQPRTNHHNNDYYYHHNYHYHHNYRYYNNYNDDNNYHFNDHNCVRICYHSACAPVAFLVPTCVCSQRRPWHRHSTKHM